MLIIPSHHLITIIIMIMIGLVIIKNMKQMMDFFLEFLSEYHLHLLIHVINIMESPFHDADDDHD